LVYTRYGYWLGLHVTSRGKRTGWWQSEGLKARAQPGRGLKLSVKSRLSKNINIGKF